VYVNTSMDHRHQRIQQHIYDMLNARLASSEYRDRDHHLKVVYELGLLVGMLTELAAEDSIIYERVYRYIRRDPAAKVDKRA
jgi:hypothetical protein